jgi:putative membrane protein
MVRGHDFSVIAQIGRIRLINGFAFSGLLVTLALGWYALSGTGRSDFYASWVIPAVALLHLVGQAGCGCAWHALVERPRPGRRAFFLMRWIRSSVASLVPVSGVGAALVAVRLSLQRGIRMDMAAASLTLDATMEMIAQILFTALGIGLLLSTARKPQLLGWSAAGLSLAVLIVAAFAAAQRGGGLKLVELGIARLAARWPRLAPLVEARLHDRLIELHRARRAAFVSGGYHFAAWLIGAGEIWLALYAFGHPLSPGDCVIIESLTMAARSAGFLVPGGLGIQEGGLVLAGSLVGLSPETAIALAVVKRLRDVAVGIPGLLAWEWAEYSGRHRRPSAGEARAARYPDGARPEPFPKGVETVGVTDGGPRAPT